MGLTYLGTGAFTASGVAEMRYWQPADRLNIDLDGDGTADYRIDLSSGVVIGAGDLIL